MSKLFLTLLNMSITAGWLALCVMLLRVALKKAPKWLRVALWGLVGLRLLLPFSIESALSLVPSAETIRPDIIYSEAPAMQSGIPTLDPALDIAASESLAPAAGASADPLQLWVSIAAAVWLAGVIVLLICAAASYLRLRGRVKAAVVLRDNIYLSENAASPFVLGLLRPRIYLPFGMPERAQDNVIAHEQAHIKRRDHIIKPAGYLLLCVYWFNPLLWAAYILLCRDIELACDERVIKGLGHDARADYSEALLSCSAPHRLVSACPLAFGEVGVKERVKNVLNYKKPAFWIIAVAVVASVAAAVCFLTDPKVNESMRWAQTLDAQSVESIELVVRPQSENKQYRLFSKEEFAEVAALLRESRGKYVANPEELAGGSILFYIKTNDGEEHVIGNISNVYLFIDGDSYDAGYTWLSSWDGLYGEGDSALPMGFFDNTLTLDDVLALAHLGEELTWADFDGFTYAETGSGLYIRVYEIDEQFSLWIGGGSTDASPMYIRLVSEADLEDYVDIRTQDVASFIAAHESSVSTVGGADGPTQIVDSADILDAAISSAILAHNKGKYREGDFACESHVLLASEAGTENGGDAAVFYLLVAYREYEYDNGTPVVVSGGLTPAALTFEVSASGEYTLREYWKPRDGSFYPDDIREKFPTAAAQSALNRQGYVEQLHESCDEKAMAYYRSFLSDLRSDTSERSAQRRAQFLALFSDPPRGESGFESEYRGDWDGDGKQDRAYMREQTVGEDGYAVNSAVVVELGNGERITAEALELAEQTGWGGSFLLEAADLTGDGQNELILLIDLGGAGGRGAYALYPYRHGPYGWELMQTPAIGEQLTLDWAEGLVTLSSGEYSEVAVDGDTLRARYEEEGALAEWERIDGVTYKNEYAADAMCDIALVQTDGRACVQAAQYVTGPTGVHVDQLGYLLTTYAWEEDGTYAARDIHFVYLPQ